MHRRVIGGEAVAAVVHDDVVDAHRMAGDDDHAEQAVAVRRRADPLSLRAAHAAGDEALDPTFLINDAQGRVLSVGQLADAIRDQLQDSIHVQHAGDAARGGVEGGQLVGGLTGARLGPGRSDDDLETAGALIDREHGSRRGVERKGRQGAVAKAKLVRAQAGGLDAFVQEAPRAHLNLGERRRMEVEVTAAEP